MIDLMVNLLGGPIASLIAYLYDTKIPLPGLENVIGSVTNEAEKENKAMAAATVNAAM